MMYLQDYDETHAMGWGYVPGTGWVPTNIHGTPADPKGRPYRLMPDGRIEVQDPKSIYFITKGLPPGATTPQPPSEAATGSK